MSAIKASIRKAARFYLTHTPIIKGRYPLMMAVQRLAGEQVTVETEVKDRGRMILDLADSAQFPLYYNIYEWKDLPTIQALLEGCNVVLDIGGNIGQMALLFARHAKKVLTFEPIPALAERLRKQVELNGLQKKVLIYPVALTNFNGMLPLQLPTVENGGNGSTVLGRDGAGETIEVQAQTLDSLLEQEQINGVDLIKIDVEGAELFVLQGMEKLLSQENRPIIILEMNSGMMKLAGYSASAITSLLAGHGYECFEFVKNGLEGSIQNPEPGIENYCFLTQSHKSRPSVQRALQRKLSYS
ncbi:MAG: FkbM family methyltransferase [Candidatus Kapaibacterium sp.]